MLPTKNPIYPSQRWSINANKSKICIPKECNKNTISSKYLAISPNYTNKKPPITTMANITSIHGNMPSYIEDIELISTIQQTIRILINAHSNHTYILCGDFNRDTTLIGCQNEHRHIPPQEEDIIIYINRLSLTYIPTNTNYTGQDGHNYTNTSLIDGFFIKKSKSVHIYIYHTDKNQPKFQPFTYNTTYNTK